jgi:uncharacterized protein YbaP (TraB family)
MNARPLLFGFVLLLQTAGCDSAPAKQPGTSSSARQSTASATASATSSPTAQSSAAPAPKTAPTSATAKNPPFLFQVKKGTAVNFIFGTMHLGIELERDINPVVLDSLTASSKAAFELDTEHIDPFTASKAMMLPEGKTAKDGLTEEQWALLKNKVAGIFTPESALLRMKPWALGALYMQKLLPESEPMDRVLLIRAREQKKEVFFMETMQEQMEILEVSFDQKVLIDMLKEPAETERMTLELASAYGKGDRESFDKIAFDPVEMKKHPAMFDLLLFKRNDAWIPKLKPRFDDGGVFVAVGAAHVMGERGLLKQLEQQGFEVSRVAPRP